MVRMDLMNHVYEVRRCGRRPLVEANSLTSPLRSTQPHLHRRSTSKRVSSCMSCTKSYHPTLPH